MAVQEGGGTGVGGAVCWARMKAASRQLEEKTWRREPQPEHPRGGGKKGREEGEHMLG